MFNPVCSTICCRRWQFKIKGKRQNRLLKTKEMPKGEIGHIEKIIDTYQYRRNEERYARRVSFEEIEKNDFNLNISRYVSTTISEKKIDLSEVNDKLVALEEEIVSTTTKHNEFLKELDLAPLPLGSVK